MNRSSSPCFCALDAFCGYSAGGLFSPPSRSWLYFPDLSFQLLDLLLLLFDGVEHRPENRVIVDHQIAATGLSHRFGDDLLHGLRAEADVFAAGFEPQGV